MDGWTVDTKVAQMAVQMAGPKAARTVDMKVVLMAVQTAENLVGRWAALTAASTAE